MLRRIHINILTWPKIAVDRLTSLRANHCQIYSNRKMTSLSNVKTNTSIRWAFDASLWRPTSADWCLAMSCVREESEKCRIRRYRYLDDAKASLVGALLIRRLAAGPLGLSKASFKRNERGRPCLEEEAAQHWDFNVSHQGSLVVLAAEASPPDKNDQKTGMFSKCSIIAEPKLPGFLQ